jgi:hypothetical protein
MKTLSRRGWLRLAAFVMALVPSVSAAETVKRPTAAAGVWSRTELYFGTNRPGGQVSDEEFAGFVDREVTPRFPDGLTLLTGYGQFKSSTGELIRERSHLLILLYSPQTVDANKKIQDIRERYKQSYQQESVLRVDSFSFVSF